MNTWIKVARYHLVDRFAYLAMPWIILAINFGIWFLLAGSFGGGGAQVPAVNVVVIYLIFMIVGMRSILSALPFALALGVSRRSYYAGTVLLALALAAASGLGLTLLKVLEEVSHGWGVGLHFFRVAYILAGPWYLTWLTSFTGLALMFLYGVWSGLVYRRWNLAGLLTFVIVQVAIALGWVVAVSHLHAWAGVGRFFTALGAAGLTGLLAAAAALLLAGGYATMRRVAV